jgi:hypothetical protein
LADYEPPKSTREKRAGREDLSPMSKVAVGKASVRAVVCATGFQVFQLINSICWKDPMKGACCGSL